MLFNLIGFVSIIVLLIPAMIYIYKSMFSDHSIVHEKEYVVEKRPKRTAQKQQRRKQHSSTAIKTRPQTQRKVVNQQPTYTTKNVSNPYDIYK